MGGGVHMFFGSGGPFAWVLHGLNVMEGMAEFINMIFGGFHGLF